MKKLLKDLTAEDFSKNQVWEYLIEENIEYAQPSDKTEINDDSEICYIVLTEFILNNKKKYLGFCSPQDTSGIDYVQPVIFADRTRGKAAAAPACPGLLRFRACSSPRLQSHQRP